jgi:DNA-directed RNA polymerase specialized sigma24 family protein
VAKSVSSINSEDDLHRIMKALLLAQIGSWKQREQIALLDRSGFGQTEIARILGTTANAVGVRLTELRRKNRKD